MQVLLTSRYLTRDKKDAEVLQRILANLGVETAASPMVFTPSVSQLQLLPSPDGKAQTDLQIHVSDPLLALKITKKAGGKVLADLSDQQIAQVGFSVQLPSGASVHIGAVAGDTDLPALSGSLNATGQRFAIVVARFNAFITDRLLQGAFDTLIRSGASRKDITIVRVPGAFEIPSAARTLAQSEKYGAILCIGCLLRGDTAHYDVIVNEVTRGIGQSAQETGVPHAFGVLTCDTLEQAIDRAGLKMGNKGAEAATAAIEMANLRQALQIKPAAKKSAAKKPATNTRRSKR